MSDDDSHSRAHRNRRRARLQFELAGPRAKLFFDPKKTRAGIVTCGGLCPGLNNVIRSLFLELHYGYGVTEVLGFRGGYGGLDPGGGAEPVKITPQFVDGIHQKGGTILGSSRGPVDIGRAVDNLIARGVNILFTVGGDGTQRGANDLYQEARRRGHALSVVGVPKTIDNDVGFVSRTFGFFSAVEEAARVLDCAHTEARSVPGGIGLVKLMGRHAGFITAGAVVASQDVNFALIPEVPFKLDVFLAALKQRMLAKSHAVIAVAEGAGQDLLAADADARDASGNVKLKDIGPFLREKIEAYFKAGGHPGRHALLRPELPGPQSPGELRRRDALRSLRAPRRPRRDGRQDRCRHRVSARALHPRAHRTPRQPYQTP